MRVCGYCDNPELEYWELRVTGVGVNVLTRTILRRGGVFLRRLRHCMSKLLNLCNDLNVMCTASYTV